MGLMRGSYALKVQAHQASLRWERNSDDLLAFAENDLRPGHRVLDFGCGTGRLSYWLTGFGCRAHGVDPSLEMIERARTLYPGVEFSQGVAPLVVGSGVYDAAVASNVLGHVDNLPASLFELVRVTKLGGRIVVLNASSANTLLRRPANLVRGYRSDPTVKQRFSRAWLANAMTLLGARQLKTTMSGQKLLPWRTPLDAVFISVVVVTKKLVQDDYLAFTGKIMGVKGLFYCNRSPLWHD